ncbi:cation efflux protein, partial [Pavlovales sp. CCMP2436]
KRGKTADYPFGFGRAHVLVGFATSIVVSAVLVMLVFEAFECLLAPSPPCDLWCIAMSVANVGGHLLAMRAGVAARAPRAAPRGEGATLPGLERATQLALLGSCAALASTLVCYALGVSWVDAAGAVVLAVLALTSITWPVLEGCASILLQASPAHLRESLQRSVRAVSALEGVLEVKDSHFWSMGAADCVASLHVRLRTDASEHAVLKSVRTLFPSVTSLTAEIDRDAWLM